MSRWTPRRRLRKIFISRWPRQTDGNGKKIKIAVALWGGTNFHFNFNANTAQTINATFALQGDHFAEFTVKPEKQ